MSGWPKVRRAVITSFLPSTAAQVLGYACYGPIALTAASYDLFWIAVDQAFQGQKIGKILLEKSEQLIRQAGGRQVYIETSNRGQYASTRGFYLRCGYREAAVLKDFYDRGDDKVIYEKYWSEPCAAKSASRSSNFTRAISPRKRSMRSSTRPTVP